MPFLYKIIYSSGSIEIDKKYIFCYVFSIT